MTGSPANWQRAALGEVCRIVSGSTPKTGVAHYWGGDINWVTPNDLSKDRAQVIHGGERTLSRAGYESCSASLFPAGSVIVSSRAPIGYVAIAGGPMCTNQGCKTAVPPDFIDSRYLYWFLVNATPDLEARASGTTFKEISGKRFAQTEFWWPPLVEQRRIVEILEDDLSRLDAAATDVSGAARRLHLLEGAWLHHRLGTVAAACEKIPLGELARDSGYGTSTKCIVDGAGPPVVRIPNLVDGRIDLTDEKRVRDASVDVSGLMLRAGDLLFVRTNGSRDLIGRTAVVQGGLDAAFASYLIRYRLDKTRVLPGWVHLVMQAPSTRAKLESMAASSAGQYNLSLGKLNQIEVPVPTIDEQERQIVGASELHNQALRLRTGISSSELRLGALRRALLSAAFAGRLLQTSPRLQELASV